MARVIVVAVAVVAFVLIGLVVRQFVLYYPTESEDGIDGLQPGELSQDAAAQATGFPNYPIAWLGEDFQGYKLTTFEHQNYPLPAGSTVVDTVILVYGTCERGRQETSCTPPLALSVRPAEAKPARGGVPEEVDITAIECGSGIAAAGKETVFWREGGIVIDVQASAEMCTEVIKSLRLANASVFGAN